MAAECRDEFFSCGASCAACSSAAGVVVVLVIERSWVGVVRQCAPLPRTVLRHISENGLATHLRGWREVRDDYSAKGVQ